ncbi:Fc.00g059380.m01.CDS01 [Cosmosporella sp. VM-42]
MGARRMFEFLYHAQDEKSTSRTEVPLLVVLMAWNTLMVAPVAWQMFTRLSQNKVQGTWRAMHVKTV